MSYYRHSDSIKTSEVLELNYHALNVMYLCLIIFLFVYLKLGYVRVFFYSVLGLTNYDVFRCDSNSRTSNLCRGGGALIATRKDVVCGLLPTIINNVEYVFVKFQVKNVTYVVCSVYIPPNSPTPIYESFMTAVQTSISLNPGCVFIICGDFNLPDISWENDYYGLIYYSFSGSRVQCVPDIFAFNNFFQLNGVSNHFGGILDLVFSNNSSVLVEKS